RRPTRRIRESTGGFSSAGSITSPRSVRKPATPSVLQRGFCPARCRLLALAGTIAALLKIDNFTSQPREVARLPFRRSIHQHAVRLIGGAKAAYARRGLLWRTCHRIWLIARSNRNGLIARTDLERLVAWTNLRGHIGGRVDPDGLSRIGKLACFV